MVRLSVFLSLFLLASCGPPGGFTSGPPGSNWVNMGYTQAQEGCSYKSWTYPEPQNLAVYIDCMVGLGYEPDADTVAKREELRKLGY